MRILFAACTVASVGLIAAGTLGIAGAETPITSTPASTPPRTVSVQGVATEAIEQNANGPAATAVYRQGMTDAIADGLAKAQFLASKAGATVAAVQSIAEGGGYIGCSGETEYLGTQPDFGSAGISEPGIAVSGAAASPSLKTGSAPKVPVKHAKHSKHTKQHKHATAKKSAATGSCTLSTQVALLYTLN
jgi:hypothetical protein